MEEPINQSLQIPDEFKKIIVDMTKDILISFPEQRKNLHKELENLVFETDKENIEKSLAYIFIYCKTFYPVRFFDILYQKDEIFDEEEIEFLPGINFTKLWSENITEKTRETIWKYLQLVLFSIVSSISDGNTFGDTAKLFEAINANEFKAKLEETIEQMHTLFGNENKDSNPDDESENSNKSANINVDDLPTPDGIHEHVTNMMNGKLGKLAKEIAEETAADLDINMENASSISDVFKRLMSNPTKLMSLVKNVGTKLDEKMKSGDVKESELLEEATEMMKKMKDMPGMGDIQSMLNKMGINTGKTSGKVNMNAMQSNLAQKLQKAKNNERILKRMNERKASLAFAALNAQNQAQAQSTAQAAASIASKTIENLVFSKGEHVERTTREPEASAEINKKNKKKNKKK
jgi:hypothetical protein